MMRSGDKLVKAYGQLRIGDPLDEKNHVGPLIDKASVEHIPGCAQCRQGARGRRYLLQVVC